MAQIQLPKNIIKMFDSVQINGIDYKTAETAVSPSAQQILAENRESAQNILQSSIEQEIGQEVKAVELNETLHNVKDELARNNILKEVSTREREITRVEGLIESEVSTRASEITRVEGLIESEVSTRASEITRVEGLIESEASTRASADNELQTAIAKETTDRKSADNTLQANIDKEAQARENADNELQTAIAKETTDRKSADNTLRNDLNNLKASTVTSVAYDSTNKKITKTINGTTSDVVTLATMKTAMSLNNVTNVATESTITKDSTKNITSGAVYTLKQTVDSNKSAIATLNGTGTGSVKKTVTDEIAKVVANAPADFDTLKEISDWIDTHEDSASAMNTAISTNATNLSNHINNKSNPHSVTKAQVGLGNVGNFKAVSTVANQGLTDTEKANARSNIGAGMSSFSGSYTDLANKPTSLKNPYALTINGKTYDGSSAIDAGVQAVANGGTGQTTANAAANALINSLTIDNAVPIDDDYFISQYISGGTTTTTYHRRPFSKLWEYIKVKISNVLGLTATAYGGKASTAETATKATSVVDYKDSSNTIQIGYRGPSLTTQKLISLAGFTDSGTKIKNVNKSTIKSWLDLGSAPYINTLDIAISSNVSVTMNTFTSEAINAPIATDGLVITHHLSSTRATQLALCGVQLFTRKLSGTTWSAWNAMWNTEES